MKRTDGLLITEIFYSLQGETSASGLPFTFIRLTGCNLRCKYCDTTYSFKGGQQKSIESILNEVRKYPTRNVLLTGGEPLLQRNTLSLLMQLKELHYSVSIETHGEISIEKFSPHARIIMDAKTPSSGMCREFFPKNFPYIKPTDEIKFVIGTEEDYTWAKQWILKTEFPQCEILFSPVLSETFQLNQNSNTPPFQRWLAESILKDGLNVRMQIQLHKLIWGFHSKGV